MKTKILMAVALATLAFTAIEGCGKKPTSSNEQKRKQVDRDYDNDDPNCIIIEDEDGYYYLICE